MPPTVSVLVTVFNRQAYVADAIQSVLASTVREIEVIVVDDHSQDRSLEVIAEVASHDPRVRVHSNEVNLGDYPNRNRAASFACGKYLKYLDADDVIYPHSLQIMVEAMERFPDAGLALSHNVIDSDRAYPQRLTSREAYLEHFLGRSPFGVGPSAAMIRRDAFEHVGGFSGRQYVGDTELWLKLAAVAPVVKLQPALVWWRRHEGQQMAAELRSPQVLTTRYLLELEMLRNAGPGLLTDGEKIKAAQRLKQHHARRVLALALKRGRVSAACCLLRQSGLTLREALSGMRPYQ